MPRVSGGGGMSWTLPAGRAGHFCPPAPCWGPSCGVGAVFNCSPFPIPIPVPCHWPPWQAATACPSLVPEGCPIHPQAQSPSGRDSPGIANLVRKGFFQAPVSAVGMLAQPTCHAEQPGASRVQVPLGGRKVLGWQRGVGSGGSCVQGMGETPSPAAPAKSGTL